MPSAFTEERLRMIFLCTWVKVNFEQPVPSHQPTSSCQLADRLDARGPGPPTAVIAIPLRAECIY
eukprot:4072824-Pleurochrysis_carterae.AAC.2